MHPEGVQVTLFIEQMTTNGLSCKKLEEISRLDEFMIVAFIPTITENLYRVCQLILCYFSSIKIMPAIFKTAAPYADDAGYRIDQHGETSFRVFFVIAPDGLCYCLGQRQS